MLRYSRRACGAKRSRRREFLRAAILRCACVAALALAAPTDHAFAGLNGMERVVSGLGLVTQIASAPSDSERLFIGTKGGSIWIYNLATRSLQEDAFLQLNGLDLEEEGGLLGLAFHPDYATNGKFYANVTVDNGGLLVEGVVSPFSTRIREYTVSANPNIANMGFVDVMDWARPTPFHNAGWMGFGPRDGHLYITSGDGGCCFDVGPGHSIPAGNAQDLTNNLMGKLLRIDVDRDDFPTDTKRNYAVPPDNPFVGAAGDDEIFAYGLRNPWKASFDRATGDLWLGDVGEAAREEIDVIRAGHGGGQDFGWNQREGFIATPVGGPLPGSVDPVYDYVRRGEPGNPALQGNSVTGGFVYRGSDPDLYGKYVFGDFVTAQVWMFDPANPYGTVQNITGQLPPSAGLLKHLTTFGEDAAGNLYIGTASGDVFRIVTDRMMGDFDSDGRVDGADLETWAESFGTVGEPGHIYGDMDGDGDVDGAGFLLWQRYLGYQGPPTPSAEPAHEPVPEPAAILLGAAAVLVGCDAWRGGARERS